MASLQNVTAVLITKLPEYPSEIKLEGFGEVIIKTSSTSVYERYLQAAKAKNDIIYIQDDDCLVDYRELFKHYNGQITNAISGRRQFYQKHSRGRITLLGWGAFFPKSLLSSFEPYLAKHGVDFYLLREADRIFSWFNFPHNTIRMPHKDLANSQAPDRLSSSPKQLAYLKETVRRLRALSPSRFSLGDLLRSLLVGEAIAWLSLPVLRNLHLPIPGAALLAWLIFVPLASLAGLYVAYRLGESKWPIVFELGKYGMIGWLNVFLSVGIFNLLVLLTGYAQGSLAVLFLAISFAVTVTHSFFWNKFWIFPARHSGQAKNEYLKFFLISGATALLETILFHLMINVVGTPASLSPELWANIILAALIPLSVLGNFAGYKLIVFKLI